MRTTLSFRTEEETRQQIDKVAESLERDRSWVINEAVANYLQLYNWQLQQIDEGIRELDAGQGYTLDEVREHFSNLQQRRPKPVQRKKLLDELFDLPASLKAFGCDLQIHFAG